MNAAAEQARSAPARPLAFDREELRRVLDPLAVEDDRVDGAPVEALNYLVACGATTAVLPASFGGAEFGWSPRASLALSHLLRCLGGTHLSLARLYEGHVNAFQLIWTFGQPHQRDALCRYVADGGWLGVWNAPHPDGPLQLGIRGPGQYTLDGMKAYASGAGLIDRPLVTARHDVLGERMVWPAAKYQAGGRHEWEMLGMRASITLPVRYQHAVVEREEIIGGDGDYHKEPMFTAGAWRFLAAQIGAGERLLEEMMHELTVAQRDGDPHQRARVSDACVAVESSLLWLDRARAAADSQGSADEITHVVRMARLAVERHLLDVIELVQRSIGLASFRRATLIERIARDLQTYLRQPAPDRVRDQVAAHALAKSCPTEVHP
ncbi:Acyl-CoA dehydrogenase [Dyella jiangningensis]|uniref:acyl-CoA dehydrogenase family protein n=1 Tax=Dyella sp. AtDHG13 TaxID=1938897 RepID=UPI00088C81B4|nr:acyl-CoA dehydrogenase family protein [Dyella sp. AtDHG13]PXV55864.1 alkylation response protein AidB-like acyl-CoA dehydrogenase [Dyella sp. AtDHG13]SDK53260.1 Acyl-CoA dehydrogenase [Dyella jiangningensis]